MVEPINPDEPNQEEESKVVEMKKPKAPPKKAPDSPKYIFITSVSASAVCPLWFPEDDPTVGNSPDGLDPIRHTRKSDFNISDISDEDKVFLASGSPYLMPKNTYTRIISAFMVAYPESILYIVDGYPKPIIEAHARGYIGIMSQLSEFAPDKGFDTSKIFESQSGKTEDISTFRDIVSKVKARPYPTVIIEQVDSYKTMKLRMDNVKAYGEKNGYSVRNFHENLLSETFPFASEYVLATQEFNKMMQGRRSMEPSPLVLDSNTPPVGNS